MAVSEMQRNSNHVVVGDILEDTIVRSTKTMTTSDSELAWLRKRLETKRQAAANAFLAGKLALESRDSASSKQKRAPLGKENALAGSSSGVTLSATKVCTFVGKGANACTCE